MEAQALAAVQEQYTRIDRAKLLDTIRGNREKHEAEYREAVDGWRVEYSTALKASGETLRAHADLLLSKKTDEALKFRPSWPARPECHLRDYDRIIRRLEMSLDEEIHLSHHDFDCYVLDEWAWKDAHINAVKNYSSARTR